MNTDPVMVILSFLQRICDPETLRQLCLVLLALYLALPINAVGGKGLGLEGKVSVNKTTENQQNKQVCLLKYHSLCILTPQMVLLAFVTFDLLNPKPNEFKDATVVKVW